MTSSSELLDVLYKKGPMTISEWKEEARMGIMSEEKMERLIEAGLVELSVNFDNVPKRLRNHLQPGEDSSIMDHEVEENG